MKLPCIVHMVLSETLEVTGYIHTAQWEGGMSGECFARGPKQVIVALKKKSIYCTGGSH